MGLFDTIFGSKREKKVESGSTNKGIRYKSDLIDMLEEDHQSLFGLYGDMISGCDANEYDLVLSKLKEFKTELGMHIYIENIQLYTYIKNYFESEADQLVFIEQVQEEMDGIVKAVVDFAESWNATGIDKENISTFKEQLEGIGAVLTKRTKMEETRLYTLYQS